MLSIKRSGKAVLAGLACSALLVGCGRKDDDSPAAAGSTRGKVTADVAIIPDANFVMGFDLAATANSAIYGTLKAMQEEQTEALPPGLDGVEALAEMAEMAEKILGLKDDDFVRMTVSAKFLGDSLDNLGDLPENLELAMAVEVKQAVTLDQLEQFVQAMAEETGESPAISRETVGDVAALALRDPQGTEEAMYLATLAQNKLIVGGTRDGVANAVKRSGKPVEPASALAGSGLPPGRLPHGWLAIVLSDAMKAEMNEKLAEAATEPGMGANVAASLQNMSGAALSVDMGTALEMAFRVQLASAEQAEMLKGLFENVALSGLKMGVTMMTGGQPLPMLDSMNATNVGGTASLTFTITEKDIDMIKQAGERQMQQMQMQMEQFEQMEEVEEQTEEVE